MSGGSSGDSTCAELVFMMGEFEARFPADRLYAKTHVWAMESQHAWRFGFSAYAVRLLQDVYFLEWMVDEGAKVTRQQEIGAIESKKAESQLYAPIEGVLTRYNDELLSDPSAINVDKYGEGWLFEIDGAGEDLMDAEKYVEHLHAVWEVTQRTIKGQLNE